MLTLPMSSYNRPALAVSSMDRRRVMELTREELNEIKNRLLQYLFSDVSDNFQHLTRTERCIIKNQSTFDLLLRSIAKTEGVQL